MRREAMDFLTATEKTEIGDDIADMVDDTHLSVAVTYRDFQSATRTITTGAYTPTYTDHSIRAVREALTSREIAAAEGLFQRGDVRYTVAQEDLPSITPTREDRVVEGSDTYELIEWRGDTVSKLWELIARRVK